MKGNIESLAMEIYKWCIKRNLWGDNCIYYNNKAIASWPEWEGEKGKKIAERLYEYQNKNPLTYFNYANPHGLSMSYEGSLYTVLNGNIKGWMKIEAEFMKLFERYGCYATYGNAWNLTTYDL